MSSHRTVKLLVSNLHCPSCCDGITTLLSPLPQVEDLSVDVIQRTVRFRLADDVSDEQASRVVNQVAEKLFYEGGYFVVGHPVAQGSARSKGKKSVRGPSWMDLWKAGESEQEREVREESERRRKHLERCALCQEEERLCASPGSTSSLTLSVLDEKKANVDAPRSTAQYKTVLSVEGMTCASCTSAISDALQASQDVNTAEVNLLASCATVTHSNGVSGAHLVELIEDLGYGASVLSSIPVPAPGIAGGASKSRTATPDTFESVFSIEGMTCASCTTAITGALSDLAGIQNVEIDVLRHKGVISHLASLPTTTIQEAIEDAGFEAALVRSTPLAETSGQATAPKTHTRTIEVRVKGMYCSNCISQLNNHLSELPLVNYTPFAMDKPTTRITYVPQTPLTIRSIVLGLSEVAPEFSAELVKAESLHERSQKIQKREFMHLATNLAVAVLFAIPTFIIAIAGMVLAPHHSTFRMLWMQPVWGAADLGTVILWPFATIVQFGVGRIFYNHAFRSIWPHLRALIPTRRLPATSRGSRRQLTWKSWFSFGSMDLLVALSTTVSYFASLAMLILDVLAPPTQGSIGSYFDSCVFLIMFILLGRTLEAYAKSKTSDAVSLLGALRPDTALLVSAQSPSLSSSSSPSSDGSRTSDDDYKEGGVGQVNPDGPKSVPVDHIEQGDLILIPPGSLPPTDGVIVHGTSTFDESSLTGESRPISKAPGDEVFTGTTNISGAVTIRVTDLGGETMLSKIIAAVGDAGAKKAPLEKLAEKLTGVFVPIVVYIAIGVLAIWLGVALSGTVDARMAQGGQAFFAIEFAVAVLVIACPCGIGLAVPCAIAVGNGLAAKAGILASGGGEAWVGATRVGVVLFDKTGTLTVGKSTVTDEVYPAKSTGSLGEAAVREMVRKVEETSTHPLAAGLVDHLKSTSNTNGTTPTLEISESKEIAGRGLSATIRLGDQDVEVIIGNLALMRDHEVPIAGRHFAQLDEWSAGAKSIVLAAFRLPTSSTVDEMGSTREWTLGAMYALSDPPRPESADIIRHLQSKGVRTMMLSGDNGSTANAVASSLGIAASDVRAGVSPEGKAEVIREVQAELRSSPFNTSVASAHRGWRRNHKARSKSPPTVMFVGDGLNDSVALAAADVSVAMGHGSQATLASADFVLLNSNLATISTLLRLSRRIRNRQMLNLGWALLFNVVCIPIAAGVLYPAHGIRLSPVWSAVLMALSSVSVVLSSLALRWGL